MRDGYLFRGWVRELEGLQLVVPAARRSIPTGYRSAKQVIFEKHSRQFVLQYQCTAGNDGLSMRLTYFEQWR